MSNLAPDLRLDLIETKTPPLRKRPKFIKLADWIVESISLHDPRAKQWVRVPLSLLDNPDFEALPDAGKYHLLGLMMLVRRTGFNHLPNDERYLRDKLGSNTNIDLELLRTKRFLVSVKRKRTKGDRSTASSAADKTRHGVDKDTDTDTSAARDAAVRVCGSRFSYEECLSYAKSLTNDGIKNPGGYARTLHDTGKADAQIESFLNPAKPAPPPPQADPQCPKCYGAGMEVIEGKGARHCACLRKSSAHQALHIVVSAAATCAVWLAQDALVGAALEAML